MRAHPLKHLHNAGALLTACVLTLAGCSSTPPRPPMPERLPPPEAPRAVPQPDAPAASRWQLSAELVQEAALTALSLLDRAYRFGGRNPDSGLDCSGMVSWVYEQVGQVRLPHNAAAIAGGTRAIPLAEGRPGDLVFFNTTGARFSHVGMLIGGGRFVHAPSSRGKYVRADRLDNPYWASRITGVRTLRN